MIAQPPNPEPAALPDLFLLNPKNRAFVEGKSARIPLRPSIYLGPLVLMLATVGLLVYTSFQWAAYRQLIRSGITTQASVILKDVSTYSEAVEYWITYRFSGADEVSYTNTVSVDSELGDLLEVGFSIGVIYLPDDPSISKIVGREADDLCIPTIFTLSAGVLTIISLLRGIWLALRARRLTRAGRLLQGGIATWRRGQIVGEASEFAVRLHYEFHTPFGRKLQGVKKINMSPTEYEGYLFPKSGTPLAVLYVNDNLYEVL